MVPDVVADVPPVELPPDQPEDIDVAEDAVQQLVHVVCADHDGPLPGSSSSSSSDTRAVPPPPAHGGANNRPTGARGHNVGDLTDRQPPGCSLRHYSCPGKSDYWQALLPTGMVDEEGRRARVRSFPRTRSEEDAIADCEAWLLMWGQQS